MRSPPNHVRVLVERLWSEAGAWTPITPAPQDAAAPPVDAPRTPVSEARGHLAGPVGALLAFWIRKQVGAEWCEITWERSFDGLVRERVTAGGCDRRAWREAAWPDRPPFHGIVVHGDEMAEPYEVPFERTGPRWERIDLTLGPGLSGRASPALGLVAALDFYPTDTRLLRSTLHDLQRREWSQRAEVLRQAVGLWATRTRRLDRSGLEAAWSLAERVRVVASTCPPTGVSVAPVRDAAERLALAVSNAVFGVGWRRRDVHLVRADGAGPDGVARARDLAQALGRASRALAAHSTAPRSFEQLHRTAAAARLLAEVEPVEGAPPPESPTTPAPGTDLAAELGPLLADWARLHERLRHPAAGLMRVPAVPRALAADTRRVLGAWLARWSAPVDPTPGPDHRTVLGLWFVLLLLEPAAAGPCALRQRAVHLAFATRELLRRVLFGRHADYREPTADLLDAQAHLVAHHAEVHLGLPDELHLAALLARIGSTGPQGATGHALQHLEHVVEVYVAGQALLAMALPGDGPGWTLAHHLTDTVPGVDGPADALRQAVGLAAVYHDTGLLLPSGTLGPAHPAGPDEAPPLAAFRTDHTAAATRLVETCAETLHQHGVLTEGDPVAPRIAALARRGEAHHAVTGAWYLLDRVGGVDRVPRAVRTQAARAVLLHSLAATRIAARPDADAAAAILVLCDELFDWEPALTSLGPPGARRTARSRYRAVRLPISYSPESPTPGGLTATLDAAGDWVVEALLPPPAPGAAPAWNGWLVLAQDLGRIDWSAACGFRPVVRLTCPHLVHHDQTLSVARVLNDTLQREAREGWGTLQNWLLDVIEEGPPPGCDALRIGTRPGWFSSDDVRLLLPDLNAAFSDQLRSAAGH